MTCQSFRAGIVLNALTQRCDKIDFLFIINEGISQRGLLLRLK